MATDAPGASPRLPLLAAALLAAAHLPRPARAAEPPPGPDVLELAPVEPTSAPPALALALALPLPLPRPELMPPRPRAARPGLAVPVAETLAANLAVMGWNRYPGAAPWAHVSASSVGRNLSSGWVLDDDDFWVNQFGHPYQGTWSFTAARSAGLGFWTSAPFTFGASWLWEVAGETTRPSINDQVTTTVAGIVFGEVLYRFAGALRAEGGAWNGALASVLAPMSALNERALGRSQALAAPPSRWRLALGGAGLSAGGPGDGAQTLGYGALSFTYGLPASEDLELEHPFDHFVLDLGWTAAADPAATLRARGLLAGTTFENGPARGLAGAYLSFDLDSMPSHRVSTSALGAGGSGALALGGGWSLEGDAIVSVVLLGAGGEIPRGPATSEGAGRDYRFGSGQQALLAARLLAGSRAEAGVAIHQVVLLAAGGARGQELLLDGTAHAAIRIAGRQGVGVEVSRYLRQARVGEERVRTADSAVRVYWALLGGA